MTLPIQRLEQHGHKMLHLIMVDALNGAFLNGMLETRKNFIIKRGI